MHTAPLAPGWLRRALRRPSFLLLAVLTLGLGIGAATAMFAVVESVLLRPLPYPHAERLVSVGDTSLPAKDAGGPIAIKEAVEYAARSRSFSGFAAFGWHPATMLGGDEPRQVVTAHVMQPFFAVLGRGPLLGRAFLAAEGTPGNDDVVVLSYALWQQAFGGDRQVLGRKVVVDGTPRSVVGVMPADFALPASADLWVPIAVDRAALDAHALESHGLAAVGRLRPGVSPESAERELDAVVQALHREYPAQVPPDMGVAVVTLERKLLGRARAPLFALLGAVGLLLVLACCNVANLLLLRAQDRGRELAMRRALGASPARLVRLLAGEALLLTLCATAFGTLAARLSLRAVRVLLPVDLPRADQLALDARVLGIALLGSLVVTVLLAILPIAWMRRAGALALRGNAAPPRSGRLADGLVVGQVALALALAAGAALAGRSLGALVRVDPGFDGEGVLTARVSLPMEGRYHTAIGANAFYDELRARLRRDPRVMEVGGASWLPFADFPSDWPMEVIGAPPPADVEQTAEYTMTSGDYLAAMGIRPLAGRLLAPGDERGMPKAVVTRSFVDVYLRGGEAVGRQLRLKGDPQLYEIVGVVPDQRLRGPGLPARAGVFLPLVELQTGDRPFLARSLAVVVRTRGVDPEALGPLLRRSVATLDPEVPVAKLQSFAEIRRNVLGEARSLVGLMAAFAALGLLLGGVGSFAVAMAWVARGRREIGVRMALGARRARVTGEVIARGARLTILGCVLGGAIVVAAARAVRTRLLFEVSPADPVALLGAALLLLGVGLLATALPARRAAGIDPMRVLRDE